MKVRIPVRGVRLPALVDARMVEQAAEQGVSLSEFIRRAVSREVGLWGPPTVPEKQPKPVVDALTWGDEPHVEREMPQRTKEAVRRTRELRSAQTPQEVRIRRIDPEDAMAGVRGVPSEALEAEEEDVPAGQGPALVLRGGAARCRCSSREPRMGGRCTRCWGV